MVPAFIQYLDNYKRTIMVKYPDKIAEPLSHGKGVCVLIGNVGNQVKLPDETVPLPPVCNRGGSLKFSTISYMDDGNELGVVIGFSTYYDKIWHLYDHDILLADYTGFCVKGVKVTKAAGSDDDYVIYLHRNLTGTRHIEFNSYGINMIKLNYIPVGTIFDGHTPEVPFDPELKRGKVVVKQWHGGAYSQMFSLPQIEVTVPDTLCEWIGDLTHMFYDCNLFNQDLSVWDVSHVKSFNGCFAYCNLFNQDISNWDVSMASDLGDMFLGAKSFNQDVSKWNVIGCYDFDFMFAETIAFNQDLSSWGTSSSVSNYRFDIDALGWVLPRPNWGTNPRGDVATEQSWYPSLPDIPVVEDGTCVVTQSQWSKPLTMDILKPSDIPTYITQMSVFYSIDENTSATIQLADFNTVSEFITLINASRLNRYIHVESQVDDDGAIRIRYCKTLSSSTLDPSIPAKERYRIYRKYGEKNNLSEIPHYYKRLSDGTVSNMYFYLTVLFDLDPYFTTCVAI